MAKSPGDVRILAPDELVSYATCALRDSRTRAVEIDGAGTSSIAAPTGTMSAARTTAKGADVLQARIIGGLLAAPLPRQRILPRQDWGGDQ
jgi:hypothetical protein